VESFRFAEKDPTMAKKRVYPAEFRAKIVELIRSGKNANAIAREYEISRQSIINWLKQADLDAGRRTDGMTSAESAENAKLRKRVRELEIERDILKKATAWFARETDSVPGKSSNS
jgi:transposase